MTETSEVFTSPVEAPKPREHLSDEQVGFLISAVGNNEAKAALYGLMEPEVVYTVDRAGRTLMKAQGASPGWAIDRRTAFSYLKQSLPLANLVKERGRGYVLTEEGEANQATAGLFLKFSSKYPEYALFDFLGGTQTRKSAEPNAKRPPILRKNIFWELTTAELPLKESELAARVGEDLSVVSPHLVELDAAKVLQFKRTGDHKPFAVYKAIKGAVELPPQYSGLMRVVSDTIRTDPERQWTIEEIADIYLKSLPENQRSTINPASLHTNISQRLAKLRALGIVEQGEFHQGLQTAINLSKEQRDILVELVTLLDGIQRQDTQLLQEGKEYVDYLKLHPEELAKLLAKAKQHSRNANQAPVEETGDTVVEILKTHPDSSRRDLEALLDEAGKRLGKKGLNNVLNYLLESKKVVFTINKGGRRYQINQDRAFLAEVA